MSTSIPDAPPPVPGDDSDWTWVLDRPCPECGFEAATVEPGEVGGLIRGNANAWHDLLQGRAADLTRRPGPEIWSPAEYACHVRDVHRVYLERLDLMLSTDGPSYENWDQDATAVQKRYDLAVPTVVADELVAAAAAMARRLDGVSGEQWDRSGHRSDGASFTVSSHSRYYVHDLVHHLWDVTGSPG